MSDNPPLIDIRSLCLRYDATQVLVDFSCVIRRGELLGIRGDNGSGKSTLLKALLGIHPLASGSIHPPHGDLHPGYVPQHAPLDRDFPITVSEFLAINARRRFPWIGGIPRQLRHGICGKLDCLGVIHLAKRPIGSLSGGELQRVRIAAALLDDPELLLLDEPSSHLDPVATGILKDLLLHLHREHHLTLVVVSHSASFLDGLATRRLTLVPASSAAA